MVEYGQIEIISEDKYEINRARERASSEVELS